MARINRLVTAASLVAAASAQSSSSAAASVSGTVTQIFLPFADQQPLVASVVAQSGDVKTLVIQCVPGTDSSDCGFPEPFTYTAGPSTVHFNPSGIYQALGEYDCKITGTSAVSCALTEGLYSTVTDGNYITTPAASSYTTSASASGTEVSFIDVTITAGAKAAGAATASATGTRSTGTSVSSSRVGGTATSASASASASATSNSASHLSGVAALLFAAPLLLL